MFRGRQYSEEKDIHSLGLSSMPLRRDFLSDHCYTSASRKWFKIQSDRKIMAFPTYVSIRCEQFELDQPCSAAHHPRFKLAVFGWSWWTMVINYHHQKVKPTKTYSQDCCQPAYKGFNFSVNGRCWQQALRRKMQPCCLSWFNSSSGIWFKSSLYLPR